ncbi:CidA/LrgA family protein [Jeotgalibaca caeni]|uniref:CidA/LrgA family protein n=1 Tax=Jeotgalibaca caeni TaxID=3028623 RepID=UPI00237D79FD|nr:CidA/LrgA family protein [Jeotgalibaca caeni]MDE1547980.1 CidA/LrgA family protein [Jeotgalibaca caeni]
MRIIKQLFWIFLFALLGEIVSTAIAEIVAIPGSVIGMVLLFFALHFKWIKMEQVDEVGTWLTDNMAIFFVPAGVGLMTNFDVLGQVWVQLLVIMLVTTTIMMAFVGKLVQFVKQRAERKNDGAVSEGMDTHV